MDGQTDRQTQTDRQMDGCMDRWKAEMTERQTNSDTFYALVSGNHTFFYFFKKNALHLSF